jgi:hypothetical protein
LKSKDDVQNSKQISELADTNAIEGEGIGVEAFHELGRSNEAKPG